MQQNRMTLEYDATVKNFQTMIRGNEGEYTELNKKMEAARRRILAHQTQLKDQGNELTRSRQANAALIRQCDNLERLIYGYPKKAYLKVLNMDAIEEATALYQGAVKKRKTSRSQVRRKRHVSVES